MLDQNGGPIIGQPAFGGYATSRLFGAQADAGFGAIFTSDTKQDKTISYSGLNLTLFQSAGAS